MAEKVLGESVEFRLEVEDSPKSVLLVLDRKCDLAIIPWQDAFRLAEMIELVIFDVRGEFKPTLMEVIVAEQAQVRLNHHKGLVAIVVEWTDRIRFTSLDALYLFARALRKQAQDAQYELRGVHFQYDRQGMLKKIVNSRTETTQYVR